MGDVFDERLKARLLAFQKATGLATNGVADTTTWAALSGSPSHQAGPTSASTDDRLTGFETGSAALTAEHQAVLARIAADLNARPLVAGGYVTLAGSGDPHGGGDLGQRRADAVRDHLLEQLTDDDTRQQIRAYSVDTPDGNVAITITRRGYELDPPHPTPTLPRMGDRSGELPEMFNLPKQGPGKGKPTPDWPDWFWTELEKRPPGPSFLSQLSTFLNETIGTDNIAEFAGAVGGFLGKPFGVKAADLTKLVHDAFQEGGEDGAKALLKVLFEKTKDLQRGHPPGPSGPPDPPAGGTKVAPKIRF